VAADYFRDTYYTPGQELSIDGERLLAFLFGVASHQTADTSWHALEGLSYGIIRMVADVERGGSYSDAHTALDRGGDIFSTYVWDSSFADEWYIPSQDILNIITRYNDGDDRGFTLGDFESCGAFLLLARGAEHAAGIALYPTTAEAIPTYVDEAETYVSGGIYEMSSWTRGSWDKLVMMFAGGSNLCDVTDNPTTIECQGGNEWASKKETGERPKIRHGYNVYDNLNADDVEKIRTEKGVTLRVKESARVDTRRKREIRPQAGNLLATITTLTPYAEIGRSAVAFGANGLALGAPAYTPNQNRHWAQGCVFIVDDVASLSGVNDVENVADDQVCSDTFYSRFGHALATVDVNGDDILDLVVGAPTTGAFWFWILMTVLLITGADSLTYEGALYAYEGLDESRFDLSSPIQSLNGDGEYAGLGWDLAVGAPGQLLASEKGFSDFEDQAG